MKYAFLIIALLGSTTYAMGDGGGSSIGPGTPQVEFFCKDAIDNVEVLIGKLPPNYGEQISVMTVVPIQQIDDLNVARIPGTAPGASLVFRGQRFEVSLIVDGPSFHGQSITIAGKLKDISRDKVGAEPRALGLSCEPR